MQFIFQTLATTITPRNIHLNTLPTTPPPRKYIRKICTLSGKSMMYGCSWLETFTSTFYTFWKFGINIIALLYSFMLCIKPSMFLLHASWTFESRKAKSMAKPYISSILICTNTFTHAKNSFKWRMTFLSNDAESEEVITNIHQSFWVHCLMKIVGHITWHTLIPLKLFRKEDLSTSEIHICQGT